MTASKEKPLSAYKEMLDAGKLKVFSRAESASQFAKIDELAHKIKDELEAGIPQPR
jgi:hypothetical protein